VISILLAGLNDVSCLELPHLSKDAGTASFGPGNGLMTQCATREIARQARNRYRKALCKCIYGNRAK